MLKVISIKSMVVLDHPLLLPDGTPVRVDAMAPGPDFWLSASLDELATRQRVSAPGAVAHLFGGWLSDELNHDVEELFLRWRERELDQRP